MKKGYLAEGILFAGAGIGFLLAAFLADSRLGSIFFGFGSGSMLSGISMVLRYVYWSSPEHAEEYQKRLEKEKIEQRDELKEKLRDKSGRYAYVSGLMVICISMVVFSVLGALEVIGGSRMIVLYLGGYLVFQIVIGIVLFNRMLRKYT